MNKRKTKQDLIKLLLTYYEDWLNILTKEQIVKMITQAENNEQIF